MSRRFVRTFDGVITSALGENGRYIVMAGMTASAIVLTFQCKFKEALEATDNIADIQSPSKLFYTRLLFGRARSRLFASLMNTPIRPSLRNCIYKSLATVSGANLDEIRYPLASYTSVGHLFARTLKDKEREIEDVGVDSLACPADGVILAVGDVTSERVEQVKGATYNIRAFLGLMPTVSNPASHALKYVVVHLQPHNYHHFHSPTSFSVYAVRHMAGETLPVFNSFAKRFDDLFTVNERVILSGKWRYGCMHMGAVAAQNVGDIRIDSEPDLRSNEPCVVLRYLGGDVDLRSHSSQPLAYSVGQHIGEFRMGSCIVLIFEAPAEFTLDVKPGDEVRVGKRIGGMSPLKRAETEAERKFAFY